MPKESIYLIKAFADSKDIPAARRTVYNEPPAAMQLGSKRVADRKSKHFRSAVERIEARLLFRYKLAHNYASQEVTLLDLCAASR